MLKTYLFALTVLLSARSGATDSAFSCNPAQTLRQVQSKVKEMQALADKHTSKYLKKLEKAEQKLLHKLKQLDPTSELLGAERIVKTTSASEYFNKFTKAVSKDYYVPHLDSLTTMVRFIETTGLGNIAGCKEVLKSLDDLRTKMFKIETLKGDLSQKIGMTSEYLQQFKGLGKYVENLNKEIFYYSQTISEFKEVLNHPEKAERKLFQLLNKVPQFQRFFQQHSQLYSLFAPPPDYGATLTGIQSRDEINRLIQDKVSANATSAQQVISQQIQQGRAQLDKLKNKLPAGGSTENAPGFKSNPYKTKSFLKRLEFSNNLQFKRATPYLPNIADLGLTVGYKFSRNGIAGIGISYQLGTGHEIRKIAFTNQGFSLRSFLDWKIEKNTYATGGFEFSYRPSMPVTDAWNPALMAGITRQQKISSRFKAKCSLLLNAFYKKGGSPNPFIFRFGYSL